MLKIQIRCPQCGQELGIATEKLYAGLGKQAKCPTCNQAFTLSENLAIERIAARDALQKFQQAEKPVEKVEPLPLLHPLNRWRGKIKSAGLFLAGVVCAVAIARFNAPSSQSEVSPDSGGSASASSNGTTVKNTSASRTTAKDPSEAREELERALTGSMYGKVYRPPAPQSSSSGQTRTSTAPRRDAPRTEAPRTEYFDRDGELKKAASKFANQIYKNLKGKASVVGAQPPYTAKELYEELSWRLDAGTVGYSGQSFHDEVSKIGNNYYAEMLGEYAESLMY